MEGSGRRTHQNRAMLKRNLIGQMYNLAGWHGDVLCITAIRITSHHRALCTELLLAFDAICTGAAAQDVMDANAFSDFDSRDLPPDLLNDTGNFVPGRFG